MVSEVWRRLLCVVALAFGLLCLPLLGVAQASSVLALRGATIWLAKP